MSKQVPCPNCGSVSDAEVGLFHACEKCGKIYLNKTVEPVEEESEE